MDFESYNKNFIALKQVDENINKLQEIFFNEKQSIDRSNKNIIFKSI